MPKGAEITEVAKTEMKSLYVDQKLSLDAISKALNISVPTVRKYLKVAGVTMRPKGRPSTKPAVQEPVSRVVSF